MFDDDIYDEEFNLLGFQQNLNSITEKYNLSNTNSIKLEIGDRIIIDDFSSLSNDNGTNISINDDYDFDDYFIVIETNQKYVFDEFFITYLQDLRIVNPRNKKFYKINSSHVKLFN